MEGVSGVLGADTHGCQAVIFWSYVRFIQYDSSTQMFLISDTSIQDFVFTTVIDSSSFFPRLDSPTP